MAEEFKEIQITLNMSRNYQEILEKTLGDF